MPYGFQLSFLPSLTLSVLSYKLSSRGILKCLDAIQESSPITLLLHFSSLSFCPCDKHCIDSGKRSEDKHSLVLLRNFTYQGYQTLKARKGMLKKKILPSGKLVLLFVTSEFPVSFLIQNKDDVDRKTKFAYFPFVVFRSTP